MAQKRMFAKTIIDSDAFLDMSSSTQNLYFHLGMRADDDGFINNPKMIMRIINSSEDDMKVLILKKFILPLDNGIIVIKHWKINNYIQSDRYTPTKYQEQLKKLSLDENKAYQLKDERIHDVYKVDTQVSIDKNKISIDKNKKEEKDIVVLDTQLNTIKLIIDYLNITLNTNYRYTSNKTQSVIKARLNEGYTYDDFVKVIDTKYAEWHKTEMQKFLRPETLFGNKFESYLNQIDIPIIKKEYQTPKEKTEDFKARQYKLLKESLENEKE